MQNSEAILISILNSVFCLLISGFKFVGNHTWCVLCR